MKIKVVSVTQETGSRWSIRFENELEKRFEPTLVGVRVERIVRLITLKDRVNISVSGSWINVDYWKNGNLLDPNSKGPGTVQQVQRQMNRYANVRIGVEIQPLLVRPVGDRRRLFTNMAELRDWRGGNCEAAQPLKLSLPYHHRQDIQQLGKLWPGGGIASDYTWKDASDPYVVGLKFPVDPERGYVKDPWTFFKELAPQIRKAIV